MTNVHPMIVHFPIALLVVIFVLDFLGVILRRKSFLSAGSILAIFAALGAVSAVITGLIAEESAWHPDAAHELLELHETLGFTVMGLTLIILIFRPVVKKKMSGSLVWAAVFFSLAAAVLVGITGYLGGEIVFRHGTAVVQAEKETARADSLQAVLNELSPGEAIIEEEGEEGHEHKHEH